METIKYLITKEVAGDRVDKVLVALNSEWSRTYVQQLLKEGNVLVNDRPVKQNYRCVVDDLVIVKIPELKELAVKPEQLHLDVIYEDQDIIVINKPKGMVVHPAPGHETGTLVNGLLAYCQDLSGINGVLRPGIVHRLDKDTSGLIMVAKNDHAHENLVNQLVNRSVIRKYIALVHGVIPHNYGTIDAPIGRNPKDRQAMTVIDNGREAITHFKVIERYSQFTLVECQLETGRTHQIRVHLKYIDFPIVGDPKYGRKKTINLEGQALHAIRLGFHHPRTDEYLEFEAPLPEQFTNVINKLQKDD